MELNGFARAADFLVSTALMDLLSQTALVTVGGAEHELGCIDLYIKSQRPFQSTRYNIYANIRNWPNSHEKAHCINGAQISRLVMG